MTSDDMRRLENFERILSSPSLLVFVFEIDRVKIKSIIICLL